MRSVLERKLAAWILARQGRDGLPVELDRRRLYVLPTRAGWGFGLLLLAMLIAALNYGNSLALLVTCLLGGLALVAMYQSHRNLLGLTITAAWTSPAFAGERGVLALAITNDSRLARYAVEFDACASTTDPIDLPRQSMRRVELAIPVARRGRLRIERLRVATTHPFGLFRAWTWVHAPLDLTVYPRPRGRLPFPEAAGPLQDGAAPRGADRDEWHGFRAFRDGDSPRQIAWTAYARGSPLLVKDYAGGRAVERLFDFDALEGLSTEARLEQLARWIVDAEARGEAYGLALRPARLDPERGPEHCRRALTALAHYGTPAP